MDLALIALAGVVAGFFAGVLVGMSPGDKFTIELLEVLHRKRRTPRIVTVRPIKKRRAHND
jgi:hypothetical protein